MVEQEYGTWGTLIGLGVVAAIGKLLVSHDPITPRVVLGRALLGGVTSMVAGVALIQFPALPPLGLCGIAAVLGIIGSQGLEVYLRRWADRQGGGRHGKS
ncbi:phage holin family protein [Cupriavidus pinatubonensis]|uniref:phage holin family protein n=1 Tax=Cupriavidus pinatubonensis TaxID=248026 RepID=UPI001C730ED9|nr:phage holin family protein [Cupriavidus pinatubonensis]QYY30293.1 phage holin family protein [Cupriavidus pinatubonensis]